MHRKVSHRIAVAICEHEYDDQGNVTSHTPLLEYEGELFFKTEDPNPDVKESVYRMVEEFTQRYELGDYTPQDTEVNRAEVLGANDLMAQLAALLGGPTLKA